ncbi:TetR/AcrR family transcriptional regulator [Tessaracoccus sp. G1721]
MARRFDPARRDRIIDATLDCIAEVGVAGTSHRKVAALADVPLGSMTYHFSGMDELLVEAFTRFADEGSSGFERRMAAAPDAGAALESIVDLVHVELQQSHRNLVLTYELYTLAARRSEFRAITERWMRASRAALERHFPAPVARTIDAYIEGSALHIALATDPQDRDLTRVALHALADRTPA